MARERVKCKSCGEYLVSAIGHMGMPMNESDLVLTFKMIRDGSKNLGININNPFDGFICGACGGSSFEIVETS
jgi:hypothetical protein